MNKLGLKTSKMHCEYNLWRLLGSLGLERMANQPVAHRPALRNRAKRVNRAPR
jgi:hypothetical protein